MNSDQHFGANPLLVDVVMVTYGRSDLVCNSLSSLLETSPTGALRITVVDNNSPDETADVVAKMFQQVTLIRRSDNRGFAVSNNEALAQTNAPFILLLNPDTQVHWSTIEHLVEELKNNSSIGMIGCRLLLEDGSFDHAAKRKIPTPLQALHYFVARAVGRKASAYLVSGVPEDGVADVEALNGAFMLVRRAALDAVGRLDERYWMYAEDLDWCVRYRQAGWRIVYDGRVTALHVKGGSSGMRRNFKLNYHFHRSMAIFYNDHVAPSHPRMLNLLIAAAIWSRFLVMQSAATIANIFGKIRRGKRYGYDPRRVPPRV